MIFYDLVLFGAICSFFVLFAAVFWDVLLLALFATSIAPKWCQNAPQRPQNTSKIDPKSTQNCPLEHSGPPRWNQNPILSFWDRFWSPIWSPLGPQNRPKIDTLREKCSKKRAFKAMFAWRGASPHFLYQFLVIFGQKTMKKPSRCCASCWYFPPLKNHVFYRLPCLWTVFLQICWNTGNLAKKTKKNMKKWSFDSISKIVTKSFPQAPKIDPKSPILGAKIAKNRQNCGKKWVFAALIFRAKKRSEKSSKKEPHRLNLTSRGNGKRNEKSDGTMLSSGAICGKLMWSCCYQLLCLGADVWSLKLEAVSFELWALTFKLWAWSLKL